MESGTIVKWLKAEGDRVEKGEPLYELDTDKVTQEVEAEASGVLLKIAVAEGEADVGTTIAVIGEQGEDVPELGNGRAPQSRDEPAEAPGTDPGRGRNGRARTADERPPHDRSPSHRGMADPRLPTRRLGRHEPRQRAARAPPRRRRGPSRHSYRRAHEGVRRRAHAAPRGERPVERRRDPPLP